MVHGERLTPILLQGRKIFRPFYEGFPVKPFFKKNNKKFNGVCKKRRIFPTFPQTFVS
jgi:hypothetical protein